MTTEQKAKAYDEAIKKLCDFYRDYDTVSHLIDVKEELANLFPELVESEDEKIRKTLKHYLEVRRCQTQSDEEYINCNNFLAWLEKQGKVVNEICKENDDSLTNEDEKIREAICYVLNHSASGLIDNTNFTVSQMEDWLKRQSQPKQKWRKNEKQMFADIITIVGKSNAYIREYQRELVDFLKSLKERYSWKPSDAQIRALEYIIDNAHNTSYSCKIAKELLEQLKKLKGE